jgi:hypothetical protein
MAASLVFQATDTDSGTIGASGTYTFAFATVASAAGQERLVAVAGIGSNAATCDFSAVTIDGQSATRVGTVSRGADDGGNTAAHITWYRAAGTASTSFNVVATYSATAGGDNFAGFCALWNLNDADTLLATTNASGNDPNVSVNTVSGGTAAAALISYSDGTLTTTWAGLTERFDGVNVFGDDLFSGASSDLGAASTPLTITADLVAGMAESIAASSVSFNPDATGTNITQSAVVSKNNQAFNASFLLETALIGTSSSKNLQSNNAIVGSAPVINANSASKNLQANNAVVQAGLSFFATHQAISRTPKNAVVEIVLRIIATSIPLNIEAQQLTQHFLFGGTSVTKSVTENQATVSAFTNTNLTATSITLDIVPRAATTNFSGNVSIGATTVSKSIDSFAAIHDTTYSATSVTKTVTEFAATLIVGSAITATVVTKTITDNNAAISRVESASTKSKFLFTYRPVLRLNNVILNPAASSSGSSSAHWNRRRRRRRY